MPTAHDLVYAGAGLVGLPWILARLARRPEVRATLRSKLGDCRPRPGERPGVWIHGVSVGEVLAAKIVVVEFMRRHPDWDVICTTTTTTGHAAAVQSYGADRVRYFPYDFSGPVERVFDALRPAAILLMELEIWPNLMSLAARRRIPVAVVNGRVTARALGRYRLAAPLVQPAFRRLAACAVQNGTMAERFLALGVSPDRLRVTGHVKFDALSLDPPRPLPPAVLDAMGDPAVPLIVGGSTHPTEEELLLRVVKRMREEGLPCRLVLVPRHPPRAKEVAAAVQSAGMTPILRSNLGAPGGEGQTPPARAIPGVLVVDTIGELRSFYAESTAVYIGGSMIPHGGQNCLEPAALGKPVVCGPYMANFEDPIELLISAGAAFRVPHEKAVADAFTHFLKDARLAGAAGLAGRMALEHTRGATSKTLDFLEPIFQNAAPCPGRR
ncbi:MAG: 3-deoxy-D-manno-octulosonic acid transferase [Planctomycetes bacterium]|nr:3-deoxy-D-manno-octulosonic acid transferase [Planctomycetota bacterium]